MIKKILGTAALTALMTTTSFAQSCVDADIVLKNGKIYTVNDNQPTAEATAILGNKIIYVGDNIGVERYACGDANIIDLAGKAVYPGLIESHGHLEGVGFREVNLNLQGIDSLAEMLAAVKAYADENPDAEWVSGRGWIEKVWPEGRFPTRQDLDEIVPDRPVYLGRADGHSAVINTKAMEMAGITGTTENPVGGHINLDDNGEPTGMLIDNAMNIVSSLIPSPNREQTKAAIKRGAERNASLGWTGFHNAGSTYESLELAKELRAEGALAHRLYQVMWMDENAERLAEEGPDIDPEHYVTTRGIKMMMDGALGSRGALFIDKYADYDTKGLPMFTQEEMMPLIIKALENGIQIQTHAIGDGANRIMLDIYEDAFKAVPKSKRKVADARWRIEHAQNIQPNDQDRFIDLDVIPSMQPSHAIGDLHFAEDRLGRERLANAYPWRIMIDKGAIIPGGSDQPVEIGDPRIEFYAAVARKDLSGFSADGWHPEYAVTREEALKMFTIWGAMAAFQEDVLGSIEVGKLADFSIFDKDLMTIPEDQIMSAENVMTIVNGKIVYQK
ncbi:amidohydrolase [Pseudemcibacter aquimaris]|uniref:amidohydrolase n=1 Tax=Pseudemcibacter aquimaris TaxID=2857064 RepID=UPI0020123FBD|nr:amidohydrolase [Pseudemcibacter aquimaris]MCC3860145.1 amidohydrolase [Pseudemcibacter aquimaris]WDU57472.1 amidohydrolase [Pseudemcibacter aquimaris]